MSNIQTFKKSELGSVRVVGTKEQPLFCLRDVCDVLGIAQTKDIKASIIKEFDKDGDLIPYPIKTAGGTQQATFITEPQLYFVLMRSDKPKVEFFDAVADSKDAISIGEVAKTLNMGIGRNRLFEILRNKSILQADNIPYQKYIDAGYFRVIEQKYTRQDGETHISLKTLVYQKGLNYIRRVVEQEQSKGEI